MAKRAEARSVRAWAIVDRRGDIHLDKIMRSKAEAWGLVGDEMSMSVADLKANGYRCIRVEVRPTSLPSETERG